MTTETDSEFDADVLYAAWRDDRNSPSPRPLRAWIDEYPRHADDLVDWSASTAVLDRQVTSSPADVQGDRVVAERAIAAMRASYETPIRDLLESARSRGLSVAELARRLHLAPPIIAKLRQRLIQVSSLPEALFTGLAAQLMVTPRQIRDYLGQPATLAPRAVYMADAPPEAAPQETWEIAVRRCPGMSDAHRVEWLAAEPLRDSGV